MLKKGLFLMVSLMVAVVVSGCETGRSSKQDQAYRADLDSLNNRVSSMQSQVSSKDQEIANLQAQLNSQQAQLSQAEMEKRSLAQKLDEMAAAKAAAKSAPAKSQYDSDLK